MKSIGIMLAAAIIALAGAVICAAVVIADAIRPGMFLEARHIDSIRGSLPLIGMGMGLIGIVLTIVEFVYLASKKSSTQG